MNAPWSSGRLRETSRPKEPDILFGWMHEDPAAEIALLPPGGNVLCVTSGGDVAFALAAAGANLVVSVDPNPAQTALVRLKLATAAAGCPLEQAAGLTVGEAVAFAEKDGTPPSNADLRLLVAAHDRPLLAAGLVDARLRTLARWVLPWLIPSGRSPSLTPVWKSVWSLLPWGVRVTVRPALRRHLPSDWSRRSRHRLESALAREHAQPSALLHRLLARSPGRSAPAFATSWPPSGTSQRGSLVLQTGFLHLTMPPSPIDLVTASNIFDTEAPDALTVFLKTIAPVVSTRGVVVLRSLFHESNHWPPPPAGWSLDRPATETALRHDQAPLCRISAVFRKTHLCQ